MSFLDRCAERELEKSSKPGLNQPSDSVLMIWRQTENEIKDQSVAKVFISVTTTPFRLAKTLAYSVHSMPFLRQLGK